jgi:hypothetical protein
MELVKKFGLSQSRCELEVAVEWQWRVTCCDISHISHTSHTSHTSRAMLELRDKITITLVRHFMDTYKWWRWSLHLCRTK